MWRGRCIRIIVACWAISMLVQILPIFWHTSPAKATIHKVYISCITVIFLLMPLCIVVFAYVNIFMEIVSSSHKEKKRRVTFRCTEARLSIHPIVNGNNSNNISSNNITIDLDNDRKVSTCSRISDISSTTSPPRRSAADAAGALLSSSSTSLIQSLHCRWKFQEQVEFRSAIIFFVIILMYGATWIPVLIMTIAGVLGKSHHIPKSMNMCSIYIMVANTMLDPLIYGCYMKDIREELISIFNALRISLRRSTRQAVLKKVVVEVEDEFEN